MRPNKIGRLVGGTSEQRSFGGDKRPFNGKDSTTLVPRLPSTTDPGTRPFIITCFQCGGPHRVRECPKRVKMNTLSLQRGKDRDVALAEALENGTPSSLGALRLLGALRKDLKLQEGLQHKGLMYVDMLVNGKKARAMVDTGATDSCMADTQAAKLKVKVTADHGKLKAVNSEAINIAGTAKQVHCKVGSWEGKIDFTVTPLDDFDIVLGLDFLILA